MDTFEQQPQKGSEFDPVDTLPGSTEPESNLLDEMETEVDSPFNSRRNPRVYLSKAVIDRLVKLGVNNESGAMGKAVSVITDQAISLGLAYLPDASDAVAIEKALADRLQELSTIHLSLMRLLIDLESAAEYKTLLHTYKQLAFESSKT